MLVLLLLLSKEPLLHWSMEGCVYVGKYLQHNVPKGFPDSNAGVTSIIIIMVIYMCYFSIEHMALSPKKQCEHRISRTNRIKALCVM